MNRVQHIRRLAELRERFVREVLYSQNADYFLENLAFEVSALVGM